MPHARALALAVIGALAVLSSAAALVVAAADTTPPDGSLVIEGGIGYSPDTTLALDVPASDDVGVTLVRARINAGEWTEFPYAPKIMYTFGDKANFAQQQLTVEVMWLDAAGNSSTAQGTFWLDWAPPDLQQFQTTTDQGPTGTITFYVGAYEEASGVAAVRFSSDGGATWGAEIAMTDQIVIWDPRNPKFGGRTGAFGTFTVRAKVRDGSGQWSNVRSTSVTAAASLSIGVSTHPTTGQPITFTANWQPAVSLPKGTTCMWEFMTGDDASLYNGDRDESFSYVMTNGPAASGYCSHWTFTLPWSTVRQYLVHLRVMGSDGSVLGDAYVGSSPTAPNIAVSIGSTSRRITTSNLPLFYVLPEAFELTVGQPAVYHAYALGGASIKSTDQWVIEYENVPETHPGSSDLTFVPKKTGHLTVCLYRRGIVSDTLAACYDPPVHRGSGSGSGNGGTGGTPAPPSPSSSPSRSSTVEPSAAPTDVAYGGPTVDGATPSVSDSDAPAGITSPARTDGGLGGLTMALGLLLVLSAAVLVIHPRSRAWLLSLRSRPPG